MLSVVRHKAVIILACILVGLVLITCGGGLSEPPAATTPNIAATVEVRVAEERAKKANADLVAQIEATVQALLFSEEGRIAFSSDRDGDYEIYVMNADGSDQTNLTNNDTTDWEASWSPDGSRIAFSSRRDGDYEIYVINADGSDQTRLTNNAGRRHRYSRSSEADPSWWSPIGVAYGQ